MSDFSSSLPVRTENAGDVIIKVADATVTSRQLVVNADGSVNITDNGSSITVDGSVTVSATNLDIRDLVFATDKVDASGSSVTVSNTVAVSSTNLDIRDLAFATDKVDATGSVVALDAPTLAALESVTVQNGAGASAVNIQDGGNSITVDGTVELGATTLAALESVTVQNGVGAAAVNIQDGGNSITVDANNLDIRDLTHVSDSIRIGDGTDFLAVNADGSINVVPQEDSGTERVNYDTSANIAGGASDNHDFVVPNGGRLFQVQASASGKLKAEVQIETGSATNVFNTSIVGFNSTATPNIDLNLSKYALIPTGARVRVIRTNRDNQAQDVYSTIILIEN